MDNDFPKPKTVQPGEEFAVAALVSGCCGIINPVSSILGIIFGAISLSKMKYGTGRRRGMAISGIVLGIVFITICIMFYIIYFVFLTTLFDTY